MNILLTGPLNKKSSSYIIRDLIDLLKDETIYLKPTSDIVCADENEKESIIKHLFMGHESLDVNIVIDNGLCASVEKCIKNILYFFYDYEKIDVVTLSNLKKYDEIWAPSKWIFSILQQHKFTNIKYIPFGINSSIIENLPKKEFSQPIRFLTITNWEERKNTDLVIQSFCEAFKNTDNATLNFYMRTPSLKDKYMIQWLAMNNHKFANLEYKFKNTPVTLSLIEQYCHTRQQYYNMLNQFDIGIFCYRSDNLNLPLLEMMSLGKPCISIPFSGASDYCNKSNCYCVDYTLTPALDENNHINGTYGNWAEITKDKLIRTLHDVVQETSTQKQNKLKIQASLDARKLNLVVTKQAILNGLKEL